MLSYKPSCGAILNITWFIGLKQNDVARCYKNEDMWLTDVQEEFKNDLEIAKKLVEAHLTLARYLSVSLSRLCFPSS